MPIFKANISPIMDESRILTITSFGGTYNNLVINDIEDYDVVRINCTSNATITGFTFRKLITIINIGTKNITIKDNNSGSLAGNRILANGDKVISKDETMDLFYDFYVSRVRKK